MLQVDGKGIVMRPDALRPATAKAAETASPKLTSRLSKGEKRYRKRIAEVGAVADVTPAVRGVADILPATDAERENVTDGPTATGKWLTASVVDDAATVVAATFDEASRRDPDHARTWVALVDGANHQIERISAEATARRVRVHILIDIVHVVEYLSAPRGARLHPPPSGERLEGNISGSDGLPGLERERGPQHAIDQWSCPGVWGGALGDPRDMAKAGLPESQFSEGATRTPAGKAPETGAVPCARFQRCLAQPSVGRSDVQ